MRLACLLLFASCALAQTSLTFTPAVITQCTPDGLGSSTVIWNYSGAGPVQIRLGSPTGLAMTGLAAPTGSAPTGPWVSDGMIFVLVAGTQELARASANVKCNPAGEVVPSALATASYLPLQVGDEWTYAYNSRITTSSYLQRRISRAELVAGTAWFVATDTIDGTPAGETYYRNDAAGRIYQLLNGVEQLYLDPTPSQGAALLTILSRGYPLPTAFGTLPDALSYQTQSSLILETGTFARGAGLINTSQDMLTGSSGGFFQGLTLVSAKIDGRLVFTAPASSIELTAEANTFDVSGHNVANCAVPCYFTACGIIPGADPPGTYKPCFQARVKLGQTGNSTQSAILDLLDPSGASVYNATLNGASDPESLLVRQVKLYSTPNVPFPAGTYQLRAVTPDGRTAIAPITVK